MQLLLLSSIFSGEYLSSSFRQEVQYELIYISKLIGNGG
jgi:hypothetical protein